MLARYCASVVFVVCSLSATASSADPFAANVRTTKPLPPAEQLKKFHLPDGFEIQLVAAEPEIQKPINLAFDARRRLWVAGSVEYPYAAKPGKGRDAIKVLEDTNGDGRADKVTTFADGLNIPIGLYPYRDGVVAYSIPEITFFRDTNGDGKADKREVLYGSMGTPRDVHGMQNAFRRGFDGWLYVCHGYSNTTTIRGSDGSKITLNSGNTYRIRLDGSRVEQFTWGQVNPFGMALHENGDLFNADCHSKPLSLLMRGGYYPSFGKPHDGLGFVRPLMSHTHGSTALCGTAICSGSGFPAEYRGSIFVGNVMTSRVHRNTLTYRGATAVAREQADFLTCDDPWFRPVDVRFGPDGALYVADFYNRIIGHYEVPLDHSGRDRHRGRIWRIVYTGTKKNAKAQRHRDLAKADVDSLVQALANPNLTVRRLATDQLSDRIGKAAIRPLTKALATTKSPTVRVHALWGLHRLGAVTAKQLRDAAKDGSPLVRIHAMRALAESPMWTSSFQSAATAGLRDRDPLVRRAAADALGQHSSVKAVRPVLQAIRAARSDAHMRHVLRVALRNQLRTEGALAAVAAMKLDPLDRKEIAEVVVAVKSDAAGAFLIDYLRDAQVDRNTLVSVLSHAAKHVPERQIDALVALARKRVPNDVELQLSILTSIQGGLRQRGVRGSAAVRNWGKALASRLLASIDDASKSWGSATVANPWGLEKRNSADGKRGTLFLSSLPGGENLTGVLRSKPFKIPARLRFYICGHLGFPNKPASKANYAQLRLVDSGKTIAKRLAPRNDLAQLVDWKLDKYAGQRGYLELVDGMAINAYAWIGVSRFEPPVVSVPKLSPQQVAKRQSAAATIAKQFRLQKLAPMLSELLQAEHADWKARAAAADAILAFRPDALASALAELIAEPLLPSKFRRRVCQLAAKPDSKRARELLVEALRSVPTRLQRRLANHLASTRGGGDALLTMVKDGHASARLLQDEFVRQKLLTAKPPDVETRIKRLVASLPTIKRELQTLINTRVKAFRKANASATRGRLLFLKQCAVCHQVQGRGALIGPQLDGIGNRGLERIAEDVLDPNRNVDASFHSRVFALASGKVIVGQIRRREGKTVVVADRTGKEVVIPQRDIQLQKRTTTSIMPSDVGTRLKPAEFHDLVAYLLTLRKAPPTPVAWKARQLDGKFRSEGVAIADVNRDGKPDILAGEFWYESPGWKRHEITTPGDYRDGSRGYSRCFAAFADDINRDGWTDYIVVGFPGTPCHWYENPRGKTAHWKRHEIWHSACNETPLYADLFGNGKRVLIMGWQPAGKQNAGQMAWFAPGKDPTKRWVMHAISKPSERGRTIPGTHRFAHGLGVGDLNGDGRNDVLCTGGWWEQPKTDTGRPWTFHAVNLGPACANMLVTDVDGDKTPDVISSSAHRYGIWWHHQQKQTGGAQTFKRDDLFADLVSQTHALLQRDIDGDGLADLVTGKRWWAHGPKGDPGSDQPAVLYWFQARKTNGKLTYIPRIIHRNSGIGTQFAIGNLNADKLPDIAVSNKKGVFVFEQLREAKK